MANVVTNIICSASPVMRSPAGLVTDCCAAAEGADGLYAAQQAREILNAASNATRQAATKDFQCDSRGSSLRHLGIDAETGAFSASSGKHTVPGHKLNPQNINSDREADWHSETALQTINKLQKLQKFIV